MCEPVGSKYLLAHYPADKRFLCGLLIWLSLRNRPNTILRKISFKVDTETETSNSITADIVKSLAISPGCRVEHAKYVVAGDSREPVKRLFQFINQVKDEGSTHFRLGQYDFARDFYMTAFLLTAEWEDQLSSESLKKKWISSSLDIISNRLQTDIQQRKYDNIDFWIQIAVRLVFQPSDMAAEKRAHVILRCAIASRGKNKNEAGAMLLALRARDIYPSQAISMFLRQLQQDITPVALLGHQVLLNLEAAEKRRKDKIGQIQKFKIAAVDISCPICTGDYALEEEVMKTPCAHLYHPFCITAWLIEHDTCPICCRRSSRPWWAIRSQ